jgi:hypothetical protein
MEKRCKPGSRHTRVRLVAPPAEFDALLHDIEMEKTPARLLELAIQLQAALAERRKLEDVSES